MKKISAYLIIPSYKYHRGSPEVFTDFTKARMRAVELLRGKLKEGETIIKFTERQKMTAKQVDHKITMTVWYTNYRGYAKTKRYGITIQGMSEQNIAPDPVLHN